LQQLIFIYSPHLHRPTADTLPWETSQLNIDTFQFYEPKLHITVAQFKTTSSLFAQPVPNSS